MIIKSKILITVAVILLVFNSFEYYFVSKQTAVLISDSIKRVDNEMLSKWQVQSKSLTDRFYNVLHIYENAALHEAAHYVDNSDVLQAYKIANQGDLTDENDENCKKARRILKDRIHKSIDSIIKYTGQHGYKLHFHTNNTRSLARIWRDKWQTYIDGKKADVTDDLSSFRYMLLKVRETEDKLSGIEIGREGFEIRGVCPIKDETGHFLGSVEFLIPLSDVLNKLVSGERFNYAVYMPRSMLEIAEKLRNPVAYPIIGNKYVRVYTTDNSFFSSLDVEEILKDIDLNRNDIKMKNYISGGQIKDYNGNVAGWLVTAIDIEDDLARMEMVNKDIYIHEAEFKKGLLLAGGSAFLIILIILGIFISFITSRLDRTTAELVASERKFRDLFDNMLDGFALHEIIVDNNNCPVDYRFLMVNPAFEAQTGLKAADILGKTVKEIIPGIESYWVDLYGKVALTQKPVSFEEYSSEIGKYYLVNAFSPAVGQFAVVCEDVTAKKQNEQEKEKRQDEILNSEKMRVVGQLAGGVAHDFNNLLGGIIGSADILKSRYCSDDSTVFIDIILESAEKASDLARKLLTFGNRNFAPFTELNVELELQDSVKLLHKKISSDIVVEESYNAEKSYILGDHAQLLSSFVNIEHNSAQAIKHDGVIKVVTSNIIIDENNTEQKGYGVSAGEYIKIEFTDNGEGIAQENLSKIYEPFFTTREVGQGHGLGLAAVLGTVTSHKGAIEINSVPGRGTSVVILLPCIDKSL